MFKSLHVGTFFDVPLKISPWFWLMLLFGFHIGLGYGDTSTGFLWAGMMFVVYFFVTVHEYGHVLAAKSQGFETKEVTWMAFGAAAQLDQRGLNLTPKQEFITTVWGPATNAFWVILFYWALQYTSFEELYRVPVDPENLEAGLKTDIDKLVRMETFTAFLWFCFHINAVLLVFNLIPAFPMDGGRILRSILGFLRIPIVVATDMSVAVSVLTCAFLLYVGISVGAVALVVISILVVLMSFAERSTVRKQDDRALYTDAVRRSEYLEFNEDEQYAYDKELFYAYILLGSPPGKQLYVDNKELIKVLTETFCSISPGISPEQATVELDKMLACILHKANHPPTWEAFAVLRGQRAAAEARLVAVHMRHYAEQVEAIVPSLLPEDDRDAYLKRKKENQEQQPKQEQQ